MIKRGLLLVFLVFASVFSIGFVSAIGVSLTDVSSTLKSVDVSSSTNLYAYEVNFDYTGTSPTPSVDAYSGYLGAGTSTGTSTDSTNKIFSVYESKLNSTQTGVSGAGELFNVTFDSAGSLERRFATFVYADGTSETVYYNATTTPTPTTPTSGGGGGGGGGGVSSNSTTPLPDGVSIVVVPDDLSITTVSGTFIEREMTVANTGTVPVTLSVSIEGEVADVIGVDDSSLSLNPGEQKTITLSINAPEAGLLTGNIVFGTGSAVAAVVPVVINIQSDNFLFDVSLSILNKLIKRGGVVVAQIDLLQVGPQDKKIDVTANYIIKDYFGRVFFESTETFFVEDQKSFTKEFPTKDLNLPPQKYILGMELLYPGAFATSSAQFEVEGSLFNFNGIYPIIFLFLVFAIITFVVIVWVIKSRNSVFLKAAKNRRSIKNRGKSSIVKKRKSRSKKRKR